MIELYITGEGNYRKYVLCADREEVQQQLEYTRSLGHTIISYDTIKF
jgi:hypothetical protein